jgi:leucyl aminopeptidase (aminopeptidase T)
VAALLAGTAAPAESEAENGKARARKLARMAWGLERLDDMKRAQAALDAAWMKLLEPYDDWDEEELPDIPDPPEEAAFQLIWEEVMQAIDHDRWPAHLHFTGV